ncbi:MAG: UDP-N-acetylmuramoyl-L-alanyl-D-glutamate--2,6-diaminopimelate ligase [Verrucomicrobiota bacterium]
MKLEKVIPCLSQAKVTGPREGEVGSLTDDSRRVERGGVFVAVRGTVVDGHDFVGKAVELGAGVIVAETPVQGGFEGTWIEVKDSRATLAVLADLFWGSPSQSLDVVGVTGTNGKTTVAYLVHGILKSLRMRAGMIGTVVVNDGAKEVRASHTTPGAVELQALLARMRDNRCGGVAMEVSSHGLEQGRAAGVAFDVAVFTNLSQDHLDYHGSMENYFEAKKMLFEQLVTNGRRGVAVINGDDRWGQELVKSFEQRLKVLTYGFGVGADFRAGNIKQTMKGMEFPLEVKGKSHLVRVPLIGRFNVMNSLAALSAVVALGIPVRDAVAALKDVGGVPGRLEYVGSSKGVSVFVDYAHTPDALQNVGKTLRELEPKRLITVFGCGGDRDRGKRAPMARAAEAHSDFCVITSDNPRGEEPTAIIEQVAKGFTGQSFTKIEDRSKAIQTAVDFAESGDVVLIAGKGHEDYQLFGEQRISFDDRVEARKALDEKERSGEEARA